MQNPQNLPTATRLLLNGTPTHARTLVPSVVLVLNAAVGGKGTGWLVNPSMIVTNEHVIRGWGPGQLGVVFPDNSQQAVNVVAQDASLDLAVLELTAPVTATPLRISTAPVEVGTQISTWGHPLGYSGPAPLLTMGHVSGFEMQPHTPHPHLVLNAAINPGNSGGPVFEWGQTHVRGVIVAKHAPMPPILQQVIQALASNSAGVVYTYTDPTGKQHQFVESQLVADILLHFRSLTQVVIGLAISTDDVVSFLNSVGVPWSS